MQKIRLGNSAILSSRLIYGCMRIAEDKQKGKLAIKAAIEAGYNHFDHADIYGGGNAEALFGELLKAEPSLRDKLILTSKAGIRTGDKPQKGDPICYDFSHQYLMSCVESSLKRLNTDYLDLFLLHRPDYLMNAEQLASTLLTLKAQGKVKHFGVSNFSPSQITLLQSCFPDALLVNQIEINIHNISSLTDGSLDQCQQQNITPMAWCPLGGVVYPAWGNTFSTIDEQRIIKELAQQAEHYHCQPWQVMLAWLLKHPANICPIIGSTTPERIIAAKKALEIAYSHEDWYRLLEARNGEHVP